jgi:hypothetical protein
MRAIAGAILLLAAAVLYLGGAIASEIHGQTVRAYGSSPIYLFPDAANLLAIGAACLGLSFMAWDAVLGLVRRLHAKVDGRPNAP